MDKDPNWMHWIAGSIAGLIFLVITAIMSSGVPV